MDALEGIGGDFGRKVAGAPDEQAFAPGLAQRHRLPRAHPGQRRQHRAVFRDDRLRSGIDGRKARRLGMPGRRIEGQRLALALVDRGQRPHNLADWNQHRTP
jgi:hypothetical protein